MKLKEPLGWMEWAILAFVAACLVYYFGWHEFDLLRATR